MLLGLRANCLRIQTQSPVTVGNARGGLQRPDTSYTAGPAISPGGNSKGTPHKTLPWGS